MIAVGTRIGLFEITGHLGAGGMGDVYRARDTRLGRHVALKLLPDTFAADPDRLMRFEREARTLAALNHPHIAQVYGVEETEGATGAVTRALVMELVPGEDLSQRIARGPLPLDEALAIARQIADALEAAHEQGIIHRDLKPANIKVRDDGVVKVLDFGLAKAMDAGVGPGESGRAAAPLNSPTITSPAMTEAGIILGTAAYMAPEQAKGKPATKRSDIWAFGCVLYEMLTGRRAFDGEDMSDTLAAVLRGEPDWSRLPAITPPPVKRLLQRALVRDPRNRLADVADARLELDAARDVPTDGGKVDGGGVPRWLVAAALALGSAAGIALGFVWARRSTVVEVEKPIRAELPLPVPLVGQPGMRLALSPDGRRLAFIGRDENGRALLWVRPLEGGRAQPIAGTEGAAAPFWSPDSRTIGFTAAGKLQRVDVAGGPITALADTAVAYPGAWSTDGTIVFTPRGAGGLSRITAAGGVPAPVTTATQALIRHTLPSFLPDQQHFVFFSSTVNGSSRQVLVGDVRGSPPVALRVPPDAIGPRVANSWLLYVSGATLLAQRLTATGTALEGDPMRVAEDVDADATGRFGAAFSASDTGLLAMQPSQQTAMQLTWFDRRGTVLTTFGDKWRQRTPVLSPSGAEVAVDRFSGQGETDIWIVNTVNGSGRRVTNDPSSDTYGVWSPAGDRLVFASRRRGRLDLYVMDAAGSPGSEQGLYSDESDKFPTSWSPDGEHVLYSTGGDIWVLPLSGDRKPRPFLQTAASERFAMFSPDGHWVAYISNESGRDEVYVTPFPAPGRRYPISSQGVVPGLIRWRGESLFFSALDQRLNVATIDLTSGSPVVRRTDPLFTLESTDTVLTWWDIAPDGQRVLAVVPAETPRLPSLSLLVGWPAALPR